ncbi:MAG TPA: DUF4398 domain-containing protein [Albitalea sp.]|nr:DUF4398 domain-containing protein [Albitalea sp.]
MPHVLKKCGAWPIAAVCAAALAACATTTTAPTEQIALGSASIEAAQAAGAEPELMLARDKLARAQAAARAGDNVRAMRLAEEADVDAQVARSRIAADKSSRAAAELDASLAALRDELNRAATSPVTRP